MANAEKSETIWVRVKRLNEKKGYKIHGYSAFGVRFLESEGWYTTDRYIKLSDGRTIDFADYLRNVRNNNDDPESPLAFDVMSEKEAKDLDAKERKAAEARANAVNARPVKPVDLRPTNLGRREEPLDEGTPKRGPGRPRKSQSAANI